MSMYGDLAREYAQKAAGRTGEEKHVDAIGEGLAAIAIALTDVAEAIRDTADQHR